MKTVYFVGRGRGFRGYGGGWRRPKMGRRGAFMGLGCLLPILCLGAAVVAYLLLSGGRRLGPFGSPASGGFSQRQTLATSALEERVAFAEAEAGAKVASPASARMLAKAPAPGQDGVRPAVVRAWRRR